ncbi:hypothetical protein K470DRAFT_168896 [Piedraia hortae CBS 480.64]|uniref:Uncharacterized protein n=1 Tax=Piedraia hortae CBS 480.64 TaxID=1314780 RepID=A0A6A7BQN1_9PEZI|nr:hypothetical protein K470DRAFT_168896 [Piedraia hortae CBS 480.64]
MRELPIPNKRPQVLSSSTKKEWLEAGGIWKHSGIRKRTLPSVCVMAESLRLKMACMWLFEVNLRTTVLDYIHHDLPTFYRESTEVWCETEVLFKVPLSSAVERQGAALEP